MNVTEYVRINIHAKTNLRHLHGDRFYAAFDKTFGISALEVQTQETENNMVSRNATNPKKQKAQTSGFFINFSPEKTERVEDNMVITSSTPQLLGQGGFKTFLSLTSLPALTYTNDKARTDHSGQLPNHDSKEYDGREQPGRPDLNLLCPPSRESGPAEVPGGYRHQDHPLLKDE